MGCVYELGLSPVSNLLLKSVTFLLDVGMLFTSFKLLLLGNFMTKLIPVLSVRSNRRVKLIDILSVLQLQTRD